MKLVIIAGGKGTRLGLKEIPKPMVVINGKPLLEHQINLAKRYGLSDIYILSGYLSSVIIDHFGDGANFGVNITHVVEDKPLSTAGAVKQLEGLIEDRFMVFYGDTIMDIDLANFIDFDLKNRDAIGSILVHPNDHPYDSDLIEVNENNRVTAFLSKPHKENLMYSNMVNAALYILSPKVFEYIASNKASDFGKHIFPQLVETENLYAYKTTEYIKDMGTPDRFVKVEKDLVSGKVSRLNRSKKQKAVFLDRDGVINKEVDQLTNIEDFELIDGTIRAIKSLNKSDYIVIVITNQPVIAKGFITVEQLQSIHKKMDMLLGNEGAFLDDLFYCPHHPKVGFEGEITALKIECKCRKPKPGMLLKAAQQYNIDLKNSWFVGDRYTDIAAGKSTNTSTILLKTGHAGSDKHNFPSIESDFVFNNLAEATDYILKTN
ncbi:HAD-IIIA family hydrolase [Winogradskyella sp. PG-2]|uniref:HAD-IIIA family hydrolase n=1 Tax=Winogradskyella sp. PG-2 TaxID=754409 RepID=UPI00045875A2|nr:HAD-IIIA family hydrolase [Winogradskyella sp. PG-2]BAO75045.1 D-glycero-D-manno-heptose 1,7-bisphosphate phosphatase [Winogradskyella sp. PG-2]